MIYYSHVHSLGPNLFGSANENVDKSTVRLRTVIDLELPIC